MNINFTVGTADDARLAAELCDFLAERMAPGAAPVPRTRKARVSLTDTTALTPGALGVVLPPAGDGPAVNGVSDVADPAALYAALGGTVATETAPADTMAETPTPAAPAATPSRDERLNAVREAVKQRGAAWFGEYLKTAALGGKKLSEFSDDELTALDVAARA